MRCPENQGDIYFQKASVCKDGGRRPEQHNYRNEILEGQDNDLFYSLKHEVEQAVMRDVIFAFNTQEESVK